MEKEYLINNNLKSLKYTLLAFVTLPVALLIGVIFIHNENNELIKIFSYISVVVAVLCTFAFLWFSALPTYYFYIKNDFLYLPISSFSKWSGEHLELELKEIKSANIEPSAENGYDLVISVKCSNHVNSSSMALGHLSIKQTDKFLIIYVYNLKKKLATKWAKKIKQIIN